MQRIVILIVTAILADCATQTPIDDWHSSHSQALAIGNRALAANNLDPARYRWHQHLSRFTDTMGKKAAWQQPNPFHNISNDRDGACA